MNLKQFLILFFACFLIFFDADAKNFTVVLDAGHGGSDPGAVRKGIYESNINLAIVLAVGEMLEKHPDIDVVYTRKTDKRLEPIDRMNTANNSNGDIYVSIHANTAYSERLKKDVITTSGIEVYIIEQFDKNKERSEKIIKETSSIISINENNENVEQKYNPSSLHSNAAFKLKQQQVYNQSSYLALYILQEMNGENRATRGVLQRSLYATWQTGMPSVLVEVGYLTNPDEREFLTSAAGQKSLARGIYNGILAYKKDYVSPNTTGQPPQDIIAEQPKTIEKPIEQPKQVEQKPVEQPKQVEQPKVETPKTVEQPKVEVPKTEISAQSNENQVVFKWQIMTSKVILDKNDARFKNLKNCQYYFQNGLYKYTYGESTDQQEIVKLGATVKKLFPDAFIILMKNGERIK